MSGNDNRYSKLGDFLREVSNWRWDEFVKAEHDNTYTTNQAVIFALVRACYMRKLDAIKLALNRLDGKLKTPVRIELPKVYYLYPNAKPVKKAKKSKNTVGTVGTVEGVKVNQEINAISGEVMPVPIPRESEPEPDLPSLSIRQTLAKMSDYPRDLPPLIIATAEQTELWVRNRGPEPEENIPAVKSVVAASLLIMAQQRNIEAISDVFDSIDGKLVETIQVLGEDIYITSYATEAPASAKINADGILQVEASQSQEMWANKLGEQA